MAAIPTRIVNKSWNQSIIYRSSQTRMGRDNDVIKTNNVVAQSKSEMLSKKWGDATPEARRDIRSSDLMRLCAVETDSRGRERSALRSRSPGSSGSSGNLCPQPARRADAISFVRKQRECEKTECRAAEQVPRFPEADRRRRRQWWVQRW